MKTQIQNLFVAMGVLAGVCQFSLTHADPLGSWTSQNSGTTNNLYGVTFANGNFVAVGTPGTVLSSPDGVTWTSHNPGNTNAGAGVIYDGAKYVVVGFNGVILTSPNLVSWAQQTTACQDRIIRCKCPPVWLPPTGSPCWSPIHPAARFCSPIQTVPTHNAIIAFLSRNQKHSQRFRP